MSHHDLKVEEKIEEYIARARAILDRQLELCESPIERLFVIQMQMCRSVEGNEVRWPDFVPTEARCGQPKLLIHPERIAGDAGAVSEIRTRVYAFYAASGLDSGHIVGASRLPGVGDVGTWLQPSLTIGRGLIRLDFAILSATAKVAVELDGHDFHERTKEQAIRDKSRDRELQMLGWKAVRFTGAEVWRDPERCCFEIAELLTYEALRAKYAPTPAAPIDGEDR